jgi:hypothetical protein
MVANNRGQHAQREARKRKGRPELGSAADLVRSAAGRRTGLLGRAVVGVSYLLAALRVRPQFGSVLFDLVPPVYSASEFEVYTRVGGATVAMWLYQMNQGQWSPNRYRLDIWERERWTWPVGRKASTNKPEPGDRVVFFYARSGGVEPGFYGWALVLGWDEDERSMHFRPVAPSDHLKMAPWWDAAAERIADAVRGKVKQWTLWEVRDEDWAEISTGITAWLNRSAERVTAASQRRTP